MKLKGILSVLAAIVFAGATVAGGTGAFFSDSETSSGNNFTAGALDLLVDSQSHYNGMVCTDQGGGVYEWEPEVGFDPEPGHYPAEGTECDGTWELTDLGPMNTFFNLTDLKPGDSGENTISLHVNDNDSFVCAIVDNFEDNDLGITEPEASDGDVTDGLGNGELSPEVHFFAWDDDGDNKWESGEEPLFSNVEGPASDIIDGVVYPLYTPSTTFLTGSTTAYLGLYWCYGALTVNEGAHTLSCNGSGVNNISQSDQILADITFYVEQARHNSDFECPILAGDDEENDAVETGNVTKSAEVSDGGASDDTGIFSIEFDVTAFDSDIFVASSATSAVAYHIEKTNLPIATSSSIAMLSTADVVSGNYKIAMGETERFTVTVILNPQTTGLYRLALDSLKYSLVNSGLVNDLTLILAPPGDYQTDNVALDA